MKKNVGIIKRRIAICLIFLMCINSFGAIVSDNDGSAFITKAEFDSLKNNFQAQIDSYNNSIDSKIDGAISQYLAGISLSTEPMDLWEKVVTQTGSSLKWFNSLTPFPTDTASDMLATKNTNIKMIISINEAKHGEVNGGIADYWRWFLQGGQWLTTFRIDGQYGGLQHALFVYPKTGAVEYINGSQECFLTWLHIIPTGTRPSLTDFINKRDLASSTWIELQKKTSPVNYEQRIINKVNQEFKNIVSSDTTTAVNSYKLFKYEKDPEGRIILKRYLSDVALIQDVDVQLKDYVDWRIVEDDSAATPVARLTYDEFRDLYTDASGRPNRDLDGETYGASVTVSTDYSIGKHEVGSVIDDTVANTDVRVYTSDTIHLQETRIAEKFEYDQFGKGTNVNVSCYSEDDAIVKYGDTTYSKDDLTFKSWYYSYINGILEENFKYKPITFTTPDIKLPLATYKLNDFIHTAATGAAGEVVHYGEGIPVAQTTSEGALKLHMQFSEYASDGMKKTGTTNKIHCMLSDNKFVDGAFATSATFKWEDDLSINEIHQLITSELISNKKIYINLYSNTDGNYVILDSFSVANK